MTTIWLVEDNDSYRNNIRKLVDLTEGLQCERDFAKCEDAIKELDTTAAPDLVLMDIGLPGIDGIEGVRRIKAIAPSVDVVMLTAFDDNDRVVQAICAGATGYLLKNTSAEEIVTSLRVILSGGSPMNAQIARKVLQLFSMMAGRQDDYGLTKREKDILQLLVEGLIAKQIAHKLGSSYHTIDTHIRNIYSKLQVHNRSGAVAKALKERIL
jgi:DNA-binding NarL/FixJ family response regulator